MTRFYLILLTALSISFNAGAQNADKDLRWDYDPKTEKVYAVKPLLEGGLGIAGLATTTFFFQKNQR